MALLVGCLLLLQAPAPRALPPLGEELVLTWTSRETVVFPLELDAGARLEATLWQESLDLEVAIRAATGEVVERFDYASFGPEPIRWQAPAAGRYALEIRPTGSDVSGEALLKVAVLGRLPEDRLEQARRYLDTWVSRDGGLQVAVVRDGEPLLVEARGLANREYSVPMRTDTPCPAQCLLWQVTLVGILRMEDAGLLRMDTPVTELLPDFPTFDPPLTVRDLVLRQVGLPSARGVWALATGADSSSVTEAALYDAVHRVRGRYLPEWYEGDGAWDVWAGLLCRRIVARASGRDFADWAQQELFHPLGMERSHVGPEDEPFPFRAWDTRCSTDGGLWYRPGRDSPTVFTTMEDWLRWLRHFTARRDGRPSFWQRLQALGVALEDRWPDDQARCAYDPVTDTWVLELAVLAETTRPRTAAEVLMDVLTSPEGWKVEHPGRSMDWGRRGPLVIHQRRPTEAELRAWPGTYVSVELNSIHRITAVGGRLFVAFPGNRFEAKVAEDGALYLPELRVTLAPTGDPDEGPLSSYEMRGEGTYRFRRIPGDSE